MQRTNDRERRYGLSADTGARAAQHRWTVCRSRAARPTVVTADRVLAGLVGARGALVMGPSWLLDQLG